MFFSPLEQFTIFKLIPFGRRRLHTGSRGGRPSKQCSLIMLADKRKAMDRTPPCWEESTVQAEPAKLRRKRINPTFRPKVTPSADEMSHTYGLLSADGSVGAYEQSPQTGRPLSGISYRASIGLKNLPLNRSLLISTRKAWGGIGTVGSFKRWVFRESKNIWELYYGYSWQVSDKDELYFLLKSFAASPLIGLSWRNHRKVVRILSSMEGALLWGSYNVLRALEEGGVWAWLRPKPVRLTVVTFAFNSLWCFDGVLFIPWNDRSYIFYLLGFIEAEGCFCVKARRNERCFSVGQAEDRLMVESVRSFFLITKSRVLVSSTINYKDDFWTIESGDLEVNQRMVEFFNKYPFGGDKIRSFRRFEAVVLMVLEINAQRRQQRKNRKTLSQFKKCAPRFLKKSNNAQKFSFIMFYLGV